MIPWYVPTQLFWYKPIFMAELLIAENLFAFRLKHAPHFLLRMLVCVVACIGFAFALPIPSINVFFNTAIFLVLFAFSLVALSFCYKDSFLNVLFCCIAGYSVQHIAFTLYDLIVNLTGIAVGNMYDIYTSPEAGVYLPFQNPLSELVYLGEYVIVYWLMFFLFAVRIQKNDSLKLKNRSVLFFLMLIVVVDIAVSSILTFYMVKHFDGMYVETIDFFTILCGILLICYQFELPLRQKLEEELAVINQLREQEKEQYLITKESIEIINQKCHDLKYQIHAIGQTSGVSNATIKEMENIIRIYDCQVKTGNKALDVILTEKSLLCGKKGINLTCIIDGDKLSFMSEADIYSLFGNAIDNAIEAVSDLEEDKKVIGVTVKTIRGFLSINLHNHYEKEIVFESGLPITTKSDKNYHGFGIKSIKSICDKYGGDLSIKCENHVFNLNLLFSADQIGAHFAEE